MNRTSNENNFRTSAYEAITSYVAHATPDVIPVVENTIVTILQRMEYLLGMHVRRCVLAIRSSH
jgi:importin subunit beta-1